jgi:hypothetical protein
MNHAIITMTKKIDLHPELKDQQLKRIYLDTVYLITYALRGHDLPSWTTASGAHNDNMKENVTLLINSDDNRMLKKISANYTSLTIGLEKNVAVSAGRIEVIDGSPSDETSWKLALYVTIMPFTLLAIVGNKILVSIGKKQKETLAKGEEVRTVLINLEDGYDVIHYQE